MQVADSSGTMPSTSKDPGQCEGSPKIEGPCKGTTEDTSNDL